MALIRSSDCSLSSADRQGAPYNQKNRESALTSSTLAPLDASSANSLVTKTNRVQSTKRKRILDVRHSFGSMDLRFVAAGSIETGIATTGVTPRNRHKPNRVQHATGRDRTATY
jgi:hypothetical protein